MAPVELERPKFLRSFLSSLTKSVEKRGWRAVVPTWVILALCFGAFFAYVIPRDFWSKERLDVAVVVYIGILTLNGLILALSWSAFSRIHENIMDSPFSAYLLTNALLNDYILYIDFVHIAQLAALIVSFLSLLILLCAFPSDIFDRVAFGILLAASAYAIKQAAAAVKVMHDLVWQKAIFDNHRQNRGSEPAITVRKEEARQPS
jgi:hypothetical protein